MSEQATFQLEAYLSGGVERIVKGILKASVKYPKAGMFMMQYAKVHKKAHKLRVQAEEQGEHIPPFLIASITDQCNLHCKGCYARANNTCKDVCGHDGKEGLLSAAQWGTVFTQAEEAGIEFILLAGGEPFVRKDVLKEAGAHKHLLFPIFTNGTMLTKPYEQLLDKHRNLLPVFSIEGNRETTDERRGSGVYEKLQESMKHLKQKGIIFGASVTVTSKNKDEVLSDAFIDSLKKSGVKAVIYVEYVPMEEAKADLAITDTDRMQMLERLNVLRKKEEEMVFIAFPGDEKSSGGCLAAGRGFFHINAKGGAEPCPFSPYSDTNVLTMTLKGALHSPLFQKLQANGNLMEEHIGGCVLFEQREKVEALLTAKTL